jgi:hypothetical protein
MIRIPQPAMALNAENVPGTHYRMWNTREVKSNEDPLWVMKNVASVAKSCRSGKLTSLVINSHGCGARLGIGTGISRSNVSVFSEIAGLITGAIYLVACRVAHIDGPGPADGNLFCCEVCKISNAYVYASSETQDEDVIDDIIIGDNEIDNYEGTLYLYKPPLGSCVVSNL